MPRCLEKEICEGIYNAYIPYLGAEALEELKACAQQCLIATGDRIMEKQDYQGDIFIASSQIVEKCIANIQ